MTPMDVVILAVIAGSLLRVWRRHREREPQHLTLTRWSTVDSRAVVRALRGGRR